MFEPIEKRESLSGHVETELTKAIRLGQYLPLQKIPTENELCSIFNVSRTVVREAIKGLSAKGIVDVRKGSGVYVSEMSIQNASETLNLFFGLSSDEDVMLQTIDARAMIEPLIASKSAVIRKPKHIALLQDNMEKMRLCPLDDKKQEAELDNQFHRILLDCIENPVLHLLVDPIFNLMPKFKYNVFGKTITDNLDKEKEKMLYYHQMITNAIVDKHPLRAENFMKEHLKVTRENYIKALNK
ncbi:FadR/GntR family transcriptional regulator [Flagellimonas myxillae]|uniref:FadR/GntR family transcriptional regulator n=1 Tax=Flagellimonas myxillae TaxID=2942214 RepID=UPI00201F9244|nr:FadR/GntR family transcriptional regulator [Muricauda myxillae]MCL6267917.1 FadR family transcriptional regulator [Muricauda myxillae]